MRVLSSSRLGLVLLVFLLLTGSASAQGADAAANTQSLSPGAQPLLLTPTQLDGLLPDTVYFRGKTAPIQRRNAAGVRLGPDGDFLAAIVDTSGYASSVQETYQMYLITETAVTIAGQRLNPGAYGAGVVKGTFAVMDVGGHVLLQATALLDENMPRPRPLQLVIGPHGEVKLYLGRSWVNIAADTH